MTTLAEVIRAQAAILLTLASEIEARPVSTQASEAPFYFSDQRRGPAPPGRTHRWFRENARAIGAHKDGRSWRVTREDYDRWVAARAGKPASPSNVITPPREAWTAAGALERAGARRVK